METVTDLIIKLAFAVAGAVITTYLVPWLRERRLYDIVQTAVRAAEKIAENAGIDKKTYVVKILEGRGIEVTPAVNAVIEGCVMELDMLLAGITGEKNKTE